MKRKELVQSREYWIADIQLNLFEIISNYLKSNSLSQTQLAEQLGVTKGYISQILNGEFDHKISKLVDLSLAVGCVPVVHFQDINTFLGDEICGIKHFHYAESAYEIKNVWSLDKNRGDEVRIAYLNKVDFVKSESKYSNN